MMYARAAANFQPGIPITESQDEILIAIFTTIWLGFCLYFASEDIL